MNDQNAPTALTEFLAGRDVACPKCAYSLRGLKGEACPECEYKLELAIAGPERGSGAYVAAMIGLGAGFGCFLFSIADVGAYFLYGWPVPTGWIVGASGATLLFAGAIAAMLRWRGAYEALPREKRVALAVVCGLAPFVMYGLAAVYANSTF